MAITSPGMIHGLSGTVTQDGWCSDGCFGFSSMDISTGQLTVLQNIPYKV